MGEARRRLEELQTVWNPEHSQQMVFLDEVVEIINESDLAHDLAAYMRESPDWEELESGVFRKVEGAASKPQFSTWRCNSCGKNAPEGADPKEMAAWRWDGVRWKHRHSGDAERYMPCSIGPTGEK